MVDPCSNVVYGGSVRVPIFSTFRYGYEVEYFKGFPLLKDDNCWCLSISAMNYE